VAFKCELIHPRAKPPKRAEAGSAGYDLVTPEPVVIFPGQQDLIPLGIKTEFPPGMVGLIFDRSSLGAKGISRHCGVIDSSYRGEWKVALRNHSGKPIAFHAGDRVAQVVFVKHATDDFEIGPVSESERGEGGFGSTGA